MRDVTAEYDFLDPAAVTAVAAILKKSGRVIESRVTGLSMGDSLPDATTIRIHCSTEYRPDRGHVVAVLAGPTGLFAHRVVACGSGRGRHYCVTRGDAALACDGPIRHDQVLGRVTHRDDGNGWRSTETEFRKTTATQLEILLVSAALAISVRLSRFVVRLSWTVASTFSVIRARRAMRR